MNFEEYKRKLLEEDERERLSELQCKYHGMGTPNYSNMSLHDQLQTRFDLNELNDLQNKYGVQQTPVPQSTYTAPTQPTVQQSVFKSSAWDRFWQGINPISTANAQEYTVNESPKIVNGDNLNAQERIKLLKSGYPINIADNPNATASLKWQHSSTTGDFYVNKYTPLIEKYSKQYNLDANIAKAILYSEASDYHDFGTNMLADCIKASNSVWPMNIQGKTWGDFQGTQYNVYNPEQNIELGIRVLKALYDAVPDRDIAKIATLWNQTGAKQVSNYGKRTKDYYDNEYWDTSKMVPQLDIK